MSYFYAGALVVGTVVSVAGSVSSANGAAGNARVQGFAAQKEGALDQAMRGIEADDIKAQAMAEADSIKRQAMQMRGAISVAQSGSGVVIGEGSAQAALDQLDTLSSADALAAIYSGVNKSVSIRASGRFAQEAVNQRSNAAAQAASSYGKAAGWSVAGGIANVAGAGAKAYAGSPSTGNTGMATNNTGTNLPTSGGR